MLARTAPRQDSKAGNNEKCMIRGKLRVKEKLIVTDLTVPLNVGESRGYLALTQSTFLWHH